MPHHLTDAIVNATGARDGQDLIARTEGDPVLAPIARAIADAYDKIGSDDGRLNNLAAAVRTVELDFDAQRDGAGDEAILHALGRADRAMHEITLVYAARLQAGKHLDVLLSVFAAADQRPADA
jgi:hypothetical protein